MDLRRAFLSAAESVAAAFALGRGDGDSDAGSAGDAAAARDARRAARRRRGWAASSAASSSYASLPDDDDDEEEEDEAGVRAACAQAPSPQAMRRGPPVPGGRRRDGAASDDDYDDNDAAIAPPSPPRPPAPPFLPPTPLPPPARPPPALDSPSALLPADAAARLAAALPPAAALRGGAGGRPWRLAYSTARDGTSLASLYRCGAAPALLVVRDGGGGVFGCYTTSAWAPGRRGYYGSGEAFVFRLQGPAPSAHPALWRWHAARCDVVRNDFFQLARPSGLALGGGPRFALALDADLARGTSGPCETFGSPCLASGDEFEVGRVEVWEVG